MEKLVLKPSREVEPGTPTITLISRKAGAVIAEISYAAFPDHKTIVVLESMQEYMKFVDRVMERASNEAPRLAA